MTCRSSTTCAWYIRVSRRGGPARWISPCRAGGSARLDGFDPHAPGCWTSPIPIRRSGSPSRTPRARRLLATGSGTDTSSPTCPRMPRPPRLISRNRPSRWHEGGGADLVVLGPRSCSTPCGPRRRRQSEAQRRAGGHRGRAGRVRLWGEERRCRRAFLGRAERLGAAAPVPAPPRSGHLRPAQLPWPRRGPGAQRRGPDLGARGGVRQLVRRRAEAGAVSVVAGAKHRRDQGGGGEDPRTTRGDRALAVGPGIGRAQDERLPGDDRGRAGHAARRAGADRDRARPER